MNSISNSKIGSKIGVVLGGLVLLLVGLSVLSLWATRTTKQQGAILVQRLTKARLADRVESETLAIALDLSRMYVGKKATSDLVQDVDY